MGINSVENKTIAAIATAMTPSGIGIIRVSGEDAIAIADKIYRSKGGNRKLNEVESHTIHYGYICDGDEIIDEVMVLVMRAPKTYTRENTIEIDCHGGILVMKRILETVIKYGARPAEPGEFTKRAFLNGRIDLSQAESVIDLINSKNEFARKSSISQLRGAVKNKIIEMRKLIIHEIAWIESALDDPEHYDLESYPQSLHKVVDKQLIDIENLLKTSDNGRIMKEGINTVILGKPNAGKSSLLNMLTGEESAIVTDIEGTTRDIIQEQISFSGITLNLMDTAGIRQTNDIIEKIGVDKARKLASEADLILFVVDCSRELDSNDYEIMELIKGKKAICLLNKCDLSTVIHRQNVDKLISCPIVSVSMVDNFMDFNGNYGNGMDVLAETIKDMFFSGTIDLNDQIYITNVRQKNLLIEARDSLRLVNQSIDNAMPEDFFSIDLMNAYESLGLIIGEAVEDDLAQEIFSKFCMGK